MSKQFKLENKNSITTAFENLKPKAKTLFTASEISKIFRAKISLALKNGYSFKEITDIFNSHNCSISEKELEIAFNKLRKNNNPSKINKLLETKNNAQDILNNKNSQ